MEGGSDTSLAGGPDERGGCLQAAGLPQPVILPCHAFLGARPDFGLRRNTHVRMYFKP